jgi:hypothetical protein
LQGFEESLAAVEKLEDPAEQLLKLEQIKDQIDTVTARTKADISSRSQNKWFAPYLSISGGSLGTAGPLAILAHIPPLVFVAVPGLIVGSCVAIRCSRNEEKRLAQALSGFIGALETQKAQTVTLSENLVKAELPGLAKSAKFADLLAVIPSLRAECAAAFSRQASVQEETAVVETKKPSAKALSL